MRAPRVAAVTAVLAWRHLGALAGSLLWASSPAACVAHQPPVVATPQTDDLGSPADMRTKPGPKNGYIVGSCVLFSGQLAFYVQGTGEPVAVDDRLRAPPWGGLVGSGEAVGCKGMGPMIMLDSWRRMDAALLSNGEYVASRRSLEVITFVVFPRPRPH